MEHLSHYRYVLSSDIKELFVNCFKQAIVRLKPKNIGFIGIVGSVNDTLSHDIDILIFPSKKSKVGQTIIEINRLYGETEKLLQKHDERLYLSLCPQKVMQEMVYYLSALEDGTAGMIPIHSLFFPDYISFERLNPKDFQKSVRKNMKKLYGDFDVINHVTVLKQKQLEPYFLILNFEMNSRIKTFPRHLIRSSYESLLNYLVKNYKIPASKVKKTHNVQEMDKVLFGILNYLDKITYA